jgi:hypothetical protein
MDEHRFDTLTRSLVASGSRRGALRLLVSLGLGGTLIPLGAERAAAQCGLVRTSTQRASRCSRRNPCCENARCKNKRCKCKPEWCDTDDDGLCETQLGTDAACKACDDACDEFQSCRGVFGTRFKDCCRPLGQVCELGQCCFETGDTNACQVIANKGGPQGCGYVEPNTDPRCCIPNGATGAAGDCDCCGTSVQCEGACIPESCATNCNRTCTSNADCGSGCFLTCQPVQDQFDPDKHRCLPG